MRDDEVEEDENGCRECGKNDKPDLQLKCSGCLNVFCHVECASLPDVPEGDWFCSGKTVSVQGFCSSREHAD